MPGRNTLEVFVELRENAQKGLDGLVSGMRRFEGATATLNESVLRTQGLLDGEAAKAEQLRRALADLARAEGEVASQHARLGRRVAQALPGATGREWQAGIRSGRVDPAELSGMVTAGRLSAPAGLQEEFAALTRREAALISNREATRALEGELANLRGKIAAESEAAAAGARNLEQYARVRQIAARSTGAAQPVAGALASDWERVRAAQVAAENSAQAEARETVSELRREEDQIRKVAEAAAARLRTTTMVAPAATRLGATGSAPVVQHDFDKMNREIDDFLAKSSAATDKPEIAIQNRLETERAWLQRRIARAGLDRAEMDRLSQQVARAPDTRALTEASAQFEKLRVETAAATAAANKFTDANARHVGPIRAAAAAMREQELMIQGLARALKIEEAQVRSLLHAQGLLKSPEQFLNQSRLAGGSRLGQGARAAGTQAALFGGEPGMAAFGAAQVAEQAGVSGAAIASVGAFAFGLVASAAAMKKLNDEASNLGQLGEDMENLASKTGLEAAEMEALGIVVGDLGGSIEELQVGMRFFNRNISQLDPILKAMGITTKDTGQALREVADWFAKTADGADKTEAAIQLFGRSGERVIPFFNKGGAAVAGMVSELRGLGTAFDADLFPAFRRMDRVAEDSEHRWKAISVQIRSALVPATEAAAQAWNAWIRVLHTEALVLRNTTSLVTQFIAALNMIPGAKQIRFVVNHPFNQVKGLLDDLQRQAQEFSLGDINRQLNDLGAKLANARDARDRATAQIPAATPERQATLTATAQVKTDEVEDLERRIKKLSDQAVDIQVAINGPEIPEEKLAEVKARMQELVNLSSRDVLGSTRAGEHADELAKLTQEYDRLRVVLGKVGEDDLIRATLKSAQQFKEDNEAVKDFGASLEKFDGQAQLAALGTDRVSAAGARFMEVQRSSGIEAAGDWLRDYVRDLAPAATESARVAAAKDIMAAALRDEAQAAERNAREIQQLSDLTRDLGRDTTASEQSVRKFATAFNLGDPVKAVRDLVREMGSLDAATSALRENEIELQVGADLGRFKRDVEAARAAASKPLEVALNLDSARAMRDRLKTERPDMSGAETAAADRRLSDLDDEIARVEKIRAERERLGLIVSHPELIDPDKLEEVRRQIDALDDEVIHLKVAPVDLPAVEFDTDEVRGVARRLRDAMQKELDAHKLDLEVRTPKVSGEPERFIDEPPPAEVPEMLNAGDREREGIFKRGPWEGPPEDQIREAIEPTSPDEFARGRPRDVADVKRQRQEMMDLLRDSKSIEDQLRAIIQDNEDSVRRAAETAQTIVEVTTGAATQVVEAALFDTENFADHMNQILEDLTKQLVAFLVKLAILQAIKMTLTGGTGGGLGPVDSPVPGGIPVPPLGARTPAPTSAEDLESAVPSAVTQQVRRDVTQIPDPAEARQRVERLVAPVDDPPSTVQRIDRRLFGDATDVEDAEQTVQRLVADLPDLGEISQAVARTTNALPNVDDVIQRVRRDVVGSLPAIEDEMQRVVRHADAIPEGPQRVEPATRQVAAPVPAQIQERPRGETGPASVTHKEYHFHASALSMETTLAQLQSNFGQLGRSFDEVRESRES